MKRNNGFFIATLSIFIAVFFAGFDYANAAARTSVRSAPAASRKSSVATATKNTTATTETKTVVQEQKETKQEEPIVETVTESVKESEPEMVILNKSSEFGAAITSILESASPDNSFAEQIRKQRAALAASDAANSVATSQKNALANNSNSCDRDLRKCMMEKCGNDFTKCALDGDTMFGDKLNLCKAKTTCTAEEFKLFNTEIKADRDMNVRLGSYERVINCGNQYNACIVNECGTTYGKCLGKPYADAAIKKCETIAKDCTEADSGLTNRFGTAIAKLRENAEKEVKRDEERMYKLRDSMSAACKKYGAMFDERTFDCIYTVNFFAGENQQNPTSSRKRYAGDTFVCMQEWFGINVTTFKENADRLTKSQTAASSAMLGSGVGTAAGLISSGAIGRSIETQKAKKALKQEKKSQEKGEETPSGETPELPTSEDPETPETPVTPLEETPVGVSVENYTAETGEQKATMSLQTTPGPSASSITSGLSLGSIGVGSGS